MSHTMKIAGLLLALGVVCAAPALADDGGDGYAMCGALIEATSDVAPHLKPLADRSYEVAGLLRGRAFTDQERLTLKLGMYGAIAQGKVTKGNAKGLMDTCMASLAKAKGLGGKGAQ